MSWTWILATVALGFLFISWLGPRAEADQAEKFRQQGTKPSWVLIPVFASAAVLMALAALRVLQAELLFVIGVSGSLPMLLVKNRKQPAPAVPAVPTQRGRRAVVIAGAGSVAVVGAAALWAPAPYDGVAMAEMILLPVLFATILVRLGATQAADPAMDERQRMITDAAHRRAYRIVSNLIGTGAYMVAINSIFPSVAAPPITTKGLFLTAVAVWTLMTLLPQGLLAWSEPDAPAVES